MASSLQKKPIKYSRALVCFPVLVLFICSLQACGFQLRGAVNLSTDLSPVYLEQNGVYDLAREIKSLLITNNIKLADTISQSKSQLVLLSEEKSRSVLSVDGSGRAKEYLLMYKVNFRFDSSQKKDKTSTDSEQISITRTLLFDTDAVLAVTNEAEIIYRDMRREAARLVLLKLQAGS